jgi:hypothetical protein
LFPVQLPASEREREKEPLLVDYHRHQLADWLYSTSRSQQRDPWQGTMKHTHTHPGWTAFFPCSKIIQVFFFFNFLKENLEMFLFFLFFCLPCRFIRYLSFLMKPQKRKNVSFVIW